MLKDAHVNVKINGELKNITVGEVYSLWMKSKQEGGPNPVEIECFHPLQRKLSFKPVRKFSKYNLNRKVVKLTLKTDKLIDNSTEFLSCEIILSEFSKLYVKTNGLPTLIPVSALTAWKHGKASVGFVIKNAKNQDEIKFYSITKVSDPLDEINKLNDEIKKHNTQMQIKIKEESTKKGRKSKIEIKPLLKAPSYDAVIAETGDGSLFVCDSVICN